MDGKVDDQDPLTAEAEKREEWRGDETRLSDEDGSKHSLPESERAEADQSGDQQGAVLNNFAPPD